jgi:hypothetical protein
VKGRRDQRERLVKEGGKPYCEFLNGEAFPDIDVALNLEMAKKCNPDKPMSVSNYKSPAEAIGVLYCCVSPESKAAHMDKVEKTKDVAPVGGDFNLDEPAAPKADDKLGDKLGTDKVHAVTPKGEVPGHGNAAHPSGPPTTMPPKSATAPKGMTPTTVAPH